MIRYWKYQALTAHGQEVNGIFEGNKKEAQALLTQRSFEVVYLKVDWNAFFTKSFKTNPMTQKAMSVMFEDLANMQQTGMNLSQMLISIADCSGSQGLLLAIGLIKEKIEDGQTLAEAFAATGAFPWIVMATVKSGEQSGKLEESFRILAHFFKRQDEVLGRLREAMIYPAIVFCLLIAVMLFVGLNVIPKLKQLLPNTASIKGATGFVIAMSAFVQKYFLMLLSVPVIGVCAVTWLIRKYKFFYEFVIYRIPIFGLISKETDLAYYFLNLSILLRNGMPLLKCIDDLNELNESIVSRNFYGCRDLLFGGMPLWESLKANVFFSSVVVFTIRRGEEMARLPEYCMNLSDYFNKRVNERIDRAVLLIQPALLVMGAIFLVIIAFAFLIPVYGSLDQIAGG